MMEQNGAERTMTEQCSSKVRAGSSITDELRAWVRHIDVNPHLGYLNDAGEQGLLNLADRIDAEHAEACRKAKGDGIRIVEEAAMEEMRQEWVKLPVDADGAPIHVGDEVELTDECAARFDGDGRFGKVEEISLLEDGWYVDGERPSTLRHVKPDSWERIIEDACERAVRCSKGGYDCGTKDLVERCRRLNDSLGR